MRRSNADGRPRRDRVARGLAAGLATAVLLGAAASPAAAQESIGANSDVRLVINGLRSVVGPGTVDREAGPTSGPGSPVLARVLVANDGDRRLDAVRIVVEVHPAIRDRATLVRTLDEGPTGLPVIAVDEPQPPLEPGSVVQVPLSVTPESGGWDDLSEPGVLPVTISAVRGAEVLAEVLVPVVHLPVPPVDPLPTAIVVPLPHQPDPALESVGIGDDLRVGSRLDRILTGLEAVPRNTVAVAVDAALLEDLDRAVGAGAPSSASLRDRVLGAVDRAPGGALSTAYAQADMPGLTANEATLGLAASALLEGRRRLASLSGTAPASSPLLREGDTQAVVALAPTDVLVVPWDDAAGPVPELGAPRSIRRTTAATGRTSTVLVGDPVIYDILERADGTAGWGVTGAEVAALTAATWMDPLATQRGLVVLTPPAWTAPGAVASAVLRAVAGAPWLEPRAAAAMPTSSSSPWTPPERTAQVVGPDIVARAGPVASRLNGLFAAVGDDAAETLGRAADELLRATSRDLTLAEQGRRIDTVRSVVDAALGTVEVPSEAGITLTADRGEVPVTLQHPDGVAIDVNVQLAAQGRLTFDETDERIVRLEPGGTTTVGFPATALSRGTFPVAVTVTTPDGGVVLDRATLSVRATAVSRTALLVVGGVVLVLIVIGARRRRPDLQVVS